MRGTDEATVCAHSFTCLAVLKLIICAYLGTNSLYGTTLVLLSKLAPRAIHEEMYCT